MNASASGYHLFDTDIGVCGIAWNTHGITQLQFPEKDRAATEKRIRTRSGAEPQTPPPEVAQAIAALLRYFAGERVDFSGVAVDLPDASDFHKKLYAALRKVSWGKTTTYGGLGKMLDEAIDARDIGQAMGKIRCRSSSRAIVCWPLATRSAAFPHRAASSRKRSC